MVLPFFLALPPLVTVLFLLMVLTVSIVDDYGAADTCLSPFWSCVVLFSFLSNPGNILRTEPNILPIAPGLFASFTKNLCSLGSTI